MTARTPVPQTGAASHPSEGSRQAAAAQRGKTGHHLGPRATAPRRLLSPGSRPPTAGKGCSLGGGTPQRKAAHPGSLTSPRNRGSDRPRRARPPPLTAPCPARAPYLRRRGEASPSPRSRGAASAEGRKTRQGLLGPGSPPLPARVRAAGRARRRREWSPTADPAGSYLGSGRSPPTGSWARAPHGDRAGR